nr:MAG TPA: hypothetical protein [Caudoviricetes sp.]
MKKHNIFILFSLFTLLVYIKIVFLFFYLCLFQKI